MALPLTAYVAPIVKRAVTERPSRPPPQIDPVESQAPSAAAVEPPKKPEPQVQRGVFDTVKAAAMRSNDSAFHFDSPADEGLTMDEKIRRASAKRDAIVMGGKEP